MSQNRCITEIKTEQTDLENGLPGKVAGGQSQASEERWHGKREASGILKIEMSLGEEKSIQAMNLLVWADGKKHHNGTVGFFFFFLRF